MRSQIYTGRVFHTRTSPVRHAFSYPIFLLYVDLSELQSIGRGNPLFGYNAMRPCSISDSDYLGSQNLSLLEKVTRWLPNETSHASGVFMLTMPRILGVGFNPASFFFCLDAGGGVAALLVEVANTYHEKHVYVLFPDEAHAATTAAGLAQYEFQKALFVSPFNGVEGSYSLRFSRPGAQTFRIGLDLSVRGEKILRTALALNAEPFGAARLASTLVRYPCTVALTLPRIAHQATLLRLCKGLKPRLKPKALAWSISSGMRPSEAAAAPQDET